MLAGTVTFVRVEAKPPRATCIPIFVRFAVNWGVNGTRSVEANVADSGERVDSIALASANFMLQPIKSIWAPVANYKGHATVDLPGLPVQVETISLGHDH